MRCIFFIVWLTCCISASAQSDSATRDSIYRQWLKFSKKKAVNFNKDNTSFEISLTKQIEKIVNITGVIGDDSETVLQPDDSELPGRAIPSFRGLSQFDSRIEIRALNLETEWDKQVLNNTRSVSLVVHRDQLFPVTDSVFRLYAPTTLRKKYNLCPGEAFADQPVTGEGTAFLIDEKTIVTAAHVFTAPLDQYSIVFGYEMRNKAGDYETLIPVTDIFYPKQVLHSNGDYDVVVVQLDRSTGRPPVKISGKPVPATNTRVYMLGHPSGLPLKLATNARVSGEMGSYYFYTTLDAFQGNSGSPVFDATTHELIGILVSGETDYRWTGSCNSTTICKQPYCKGEKAIMINKVLADFLPRR